MIWALMGVGAREGGRRDGRLSHWMARLRDNHRTGSEKESVLCRDVEQSEQGHTLREFRIYYELSSYYVDVTIVLHLWKRQHVTWTGPQWEWMIWEEQINTLSKFISLSQIRQLNLGCFTSGDEDRKGLMYILESCTFRSWSPSPRVTPIVAITRAWK